MEALVAMRATLTNLENHFGFLGAIYQLLQALRSGELTGICDQFHGQNASNRPIYELPDEAADFVLPKQFWGYAQWQNEGETTVQAANQPFDPWVFNADWHNGNFCASGSRGRGNIPIFRKAMGVRLRMSEAEAFLTIRGMSPDWAEAKLGYIDSGNRSIQAADSRSNHAASGPDSDELPSDEKIFEKMLELMKKGNSRDQAAKAIRNEPGFRPVGNEHARRAVAGKLKRGRPPKKIGSEIGQETRTC